VFFRLSVCHSCLGERSYVMPDLRHSFGIVFLDTLGTMCHFSSLVFVILFVSLYCLFLF
jgi:hypothetical protein